MQYDRCGGRWYRTVGLEDRAGAEVAALLAALQLCSWPCAVEPWSLALWVRLQRGRQSASATRPMRSEHEFAVFLLLGGERERVGNGACRTALGR